MLNAALGSKDELGAIILGELKEIGVKCRKEKKAKTVEDKSGKRIFRTHLHLLELADVFVASGSVVQIPKFVADACNRVLEQVETEGIFRKAGSTIRQREIRVSLESGLSLGKTHHVIDVANVIKYFFRELPEPLISCALQDTLLRCLNVREHTVKAVLLTCLLLPSLTLNTLAFFMQFLHTVAASVHHNKMSAQNLAIIFVPALMPFTDISGQHFNSHVQVVQLLIEHANSIGVVPSNIIERLQINEAMTRSVDGLDVAQKRKKKRRSDMFNGLRKIVGTALGSAENLENTPEHKLATAVAAHANDLATCQMQPALSTPCIKSTKKRKFTEPVCAFSAKKKRDLLALLPSNSGGILPNTPLTKTLKKSRLSLGGNRHHAKTAPTAAGSGNAVMMSSASVERRWSIVGSGWPKRNKNVAAATATVTTAAVTEIKSHHQSFEGALQQAHDWRDSTNSDGNRDTTPRQMKRPKVDLNCSLTCDTTFLDAKASSQQCANMELASSLSDTESVRISKTEYEAIKERVAAIETRISQEFNNVCTSLVRTTDVLESQLSGPERVLNKYEQMVVSSDTLSSPGTEQLAQRLSRDLKIRRSIDQRIIRSPSARKIGTLRRRSQDKHRLSRNPTWHISSTSNDFGQTQPKPLITPASPAISSTCLYHRANLKRGRPNTVQSGLVHQQYTPIAEQSLSSMNISSACKEQQHVDANEQWTAGELFSFVQATDNSRFDTSTQSGSHAVPAFATDSASKPKFSAVKPIDFDASTPLKTNRNRGGGDHSDAVICTPMLPPKSLPRKMGALRTTPNTAGKAATARGHHGGMLRGNGPCTPSLDEEGNGRASIARLRSQNAGQVMAKARLFDGICKSNNSSQNNNDTTANTHKDTKMGIERKAVAAAGHMPHSQSMLRDKQWEKCKLQMPPARKCAGVAVSNTTVKAATMETAEAYAISTTPTAISSNATKPKKSSNIISRSPAGSIMKNRRRLSIPTKLANRHQHALSTIVRDDSVCDTARAVARVNRPLKTQLNEQQQQQQFHHHQHAKDSIAASPRIQRISKNVNYKFS